MKFSEQMLKEKLDRQKENLSFSHKRISFVFQF